MLDRSQMLASAQQIFARAEERPPRNEQETIQRVVLPILKELAGYIPEEDFYYEHTSLAGRADIYYEAPSKQDALWIEVKDWNTPLEDKHAVQLVNYVNAQGGRWGVLTNGREWQLYDCHLTHLPAQDRLVLRAHKDDLQSIVGFMQVVGKSAVHAKQVEALLKPLRLVNLLKTLLVNPSPEHPLFGSLHDALRTEFPNLTNKELSDALCEAVRSITNNENPQSTTPVLSATSVASPLPETPVNTDELLTQHYRSWRDAWVTFVQHYYRVDAEKIRNYLKQKRDFYSEPRRTKKRGNIRTTPLNNNEHFYRYRSPKEIQERLREIASLFGLSGRQIQVRGEPFTL